MTDAPFASYLAASGIKDLTVILGTLPPVGRRVALLGGRGVSLVKAPARRVPIPSSCEIVTCSRTPVRPAFGRRYRHTD
jgi:hypothetical protein